MSGARAATPEKTAAISARLASSATRCKSQMGAYGACVQTHMPDVQKGACAAQLEALAACVFPNALGRR